MPTSITYVYSIASCWCFCMFCCKFNLCHGRIVPSKWCGRLDLILSIHREHLLHHCSVWLKMSLDPAPTMATSWPRLLCSYGLLFLSCFMVTLLFVNRNPKPRHDLHKRSRLNMKIGYLQSFHQCASVFNTAAAYISQCPPCCPHQKKIPKKKKQPETQLRLLSCLFLITVYLGTKGLVHSEAELLKLSVLHPLFNTEAGGPTRYQGPGGGAVCWSTSTWTVIPEVLTNTAKVSGVFVRNTMKIRFKYIFFIEAVEALKLKCFFCYFSSRYQEKLTHSSKQSSKNSEAKTFNSFYCFFSFSPGVREKFQIHDSRHWVISCMARQNWIWNWVWIYASTCRYLVKL